MREKYNGCSVPLLCRIRGAVIGSIWPQIIVACLYTAGVASVYYYYGWYFGIPEISSTGIAVGMLLGFRTNTSYDRFWEGRELWSELTSSIRNLMRTFCVMIEDKQDSKLIIEKISAVNLLVAFAYATKHYLREEYSYDEDELLVFAGHLPHLLTPTATDSVVFQEKMEEAISDRMAEQKKHIPSSGTDSSAIGLNSLKKSLARRRALTGEERTHPGSNIPLEISYWLTSFTRNCKNRGLIDDPTSRVVDNAITRMVYCLTGFERIRRTPIPLAYRVHLTHVTWIILLILPHRWLQTMGYYAVAAMAVASFTMLGILGIGGEIEDPFGYDYNDLHLDDFCLILHKEAIALTAQALPRYESWTFSEDNHPLMSNPQINTNQLIQFAPEELTKILFRGKGVRITGRMSRLHSKSKDIEDDEN